MTQFVVLDPENVGAFAGSGVIIGLDISAFDESIDYISVALPAFPATRVTQGSSFIDISSDPSGSFDPTVTDSIPLSSSSSPLTAGDCELRIPLSLLTNADKTSITGIRFRITVTATCIFRAMAIRVISSDWVYAPLDMNTLYDRIEPTVPPTGNVSSDYDFPTQTFTGYEDWPILYFSDVPAGLNDPRPIDASLSIVFSTGSLAAAIGSVYNRVSLFMRELSVAETNQLTLNGQSQSALNAFQHSLDYDDRTMVPRVQNQIDPLPQVILDQYSQRNLESTEDYITKAWIEARFEWNVSGGALYLIDATETGYSFSDLPTILPNSNYMMIVDLRENDIRVQIYRLDGQGNVLEPRFYDTGTIRDTALFKRRKGRIGWYADLLDGDAAVLSIRPRGFNFAEFNSVAYNSFTPVEGARLFVDSSPDIELYSNIMAGPWGGVIFTDTTRSNSGKSYRMENKASQPFQGIQTNQFYLDDLDFTSISFDLLFPSSALLSNTHTGGLNVVLIGEHHRLIELHMSPIAPDQWSHVEIKLTRAILQTGKYALVIMQSLSTIDTTWYIDNLSINTRAINWAARGRHPDAWGMNQSPWIPFGDKLNSYTDGILFERGPQLQVKGEARRSDAMIHQMQVIPKYSQIGNFSWNNDVQTFDSPPTPVITTISDTSRVLTLTGIHSTGDVSYYRWWLGDGSIAYGPYVRHTYRESGDYAVSLIITDPKGQVVSTTETITVT